METASRIFWIPGPLPGLNELVASAKGRGGRGHAYAALKKEWSRTISERALIAGIHRGGPFAGPVKLSFEWGERDKRRDPDNVAAGGRKLILDALVSVRVLQGDGWRWIAGWSDLWYVDARPGVKVSITGAAL